MTHKKIVLDTNVVISALLFRGRVSRLHTLWKEKAFTIVASREIVEEYIKVLAYPKFNLKEEEIKVLDPRRRLLRELKALKIILPQFFRKLNRVVKMWW